MYNTSTGQLVIILSHFIWLLTKQKTIHAGFQHGSFVPQGQDRSCCFWRKQKRSIWQGETFTIEHFLVSLRQVAFSFWTNIRAVCTSPHVLKAFNEQLYQRCSADIFFVTYFFSLSQIPWVYLALYFLIFELCVIVSSICQLPAPGYTETFQCKSFDVKLRCITEHIWLSVGWSISGAAKRPFF